MYRNFYQLDELPFALTLNPRFLVFTADYNETLAALHYGLETSKGLMVLTGEVGTGKTMALRWTMHRLDVSTLTAYIFNPCLAVEDFYRTIMNLFGLTEWDNKAEMLKMLGDALAERYRRGLRTVLIIDEAHHLSDAVLEEIRLLLNFESDLGKHLQIILAGQPELRATLNKSNLRQLKQRIDLRCQTFNLPNVSETARYISERLLIAGSKTGGIFTREAIDAVFAHSQGNPRSINNLCDNALCVGYAAGERFISRHTVEFAAENLDLLPPVPIAPPRREIPAPRPNSWQTPPAPRRASAEAVDFFNFVSTF